MTDNIRATVTDVVNRFVDQNLILGAVVEVSRHGERCSVSGGLAMVGQPHSMPSSSRFEVGCITKLCVAITALELATRKELDLYCPVSRYLPELEGSPADHFTMQHLLSHTAGYRPESLHDPDIRQGWTWSEFAAFFKGTEQMFAPGRVFNYVHSESVIAGEVLRAVTGHSPTELICKQFGIPDEFSESDLVQGHTFHAQERQFTKAVESELSELWEASLTGPLMMVSEILRIGEGMIPPRSVRLANGLSAESLELLYKPVVKLPNFASTGGEEHPTAFSLGCGRYRSGLHGLSGSLAGQCVALRVDPEHAVAVAVGLNTHQPMMRDRLANRLCAALIADVCPSPETANEMTLQDFAGEYHASLHDGWKAAVNGNRLVLSRLHDPAIARGRLEVIEMARDKSGRFVSVRDNQSQSVGFAREENSGNAYLVIGTTAYKKSSTVH